MRKVKFLFLLCFSSLYSNIGQFIVSCFAGLTAGSAYYFPQQFSNEVYFFTNNICYENADYKKLDLFEESLFNDSLIIGGAVVASLALRNKLNLRYLFRSLSRQGNVRALLGIDSDKK